MNQIGDRLRTYFKKINKAYVGFKESERGKFIIGFSGIVLVYGLLISFVAWSIFGDKVSTAKILGYGIIYYFLNEELLDFIKRAKRC